eukprot:353618-Chlamydomonas_euryale.AAC.10
MPRPSASLAAPVPHLCHNCATTVPHLCRSASAVAAAQAAAAALSVVTTSVTSSRRSSDAPPTPTLPLLLPPALAALPAALHLASALASRRCVIPARLATSACMCAAVCPPTTVMTTKRMHGASLLRVPCVVVPPPCTCSATVNAVASRSRSKWSSGFSGPNRPTCASPAAAYAA